MTTKIQSEITELDAVVVGAGFAGLFLLYRLREQGLKTKILEAGSDIGGTWFWNRYPGARCDVESMQYSYQFDEDLQQEWEWTERYATQGEILRYINHVADRFDLRPDIELDSRVASAVFDETAKRWLVTTTDGRAYSAFYCVMATGCLSAANAPEFPGMADFDGRVYHTGQWPHEEIDFTGRRVGVIGTGSSAVQAIPLIAEQAEHVTVFQRTANYVVPAWNKPLDPEDQKDFKAHYPEHRENANKLPGAFLIDYTEDNALDVTDDERKKVFEKAWAAGGIAFMAAFADLPFNQKANDLAAEFVREKIRDSVGTAEIAEKLCPDTVIGCKRVSLGTDYYETFTRPNVTLVDVSESSIDHVEPGGICVGEETYEIDDLVLATGFDAMTGSLLRMDIRGVNGQTLQEKWYAGPITFLGLMTAGFPNMFTVSGPGSPSVLSNMLPTIEQHVEWISACIGYLRENDISTIDPIPEVEQEWVAHVNEVAEPTLRYTCSSWYLGANIPGKPRVFMPYIGGFPSYTEKCDDVVAKGYEGFTLS